jgi:Zn finger protein HypA/HybF involved in hydrogenase expression
MCTDINILREKWNKNHKITFDNVFCKRGNYYITIFSKIKSFLIREKYFEYKCLECGINNWNNKTLILQMDHIDGDKQNNILNNLRLLCPNCHSQTDTFSNRKKDTILKVHIDEKIIIETIKSCHNIREVLIKLNLQPHGGNYPRIQKILNGNPYLKFLDKPTLPKTPNYIRDEKCLTKECNNIRTKRGTTGLCYDCLVKLSRKVERPSKETLIKLLRDHSIIAISLKYNVSDQAIRKWLISYKLPYKKDGIKKFINDIGEIYNVKISLTEEQLKKYSERQRGTNAATAKLNDEKAREIRSKANKGYTQIKLAQEYNVSESAINSVIKRRSWRHVE